MVKGQEFHPIIQNIFEDVKGFQTSEQLQVNCPRCQERDGLSKSDGKFNLEINTAKRMFRCWKCDEPKFSGSLGRLIKQYGSHIDYEMYKSYSSAYGEFYHNEDDDDEVVTVKLPKDMIPFSQMVEGNLEHFEAYNYLINVRKLTRYAILKYKMGFCLTGYYEKRIIVPSYDDKGNLNYFVGRYYGDGKKQPTYRNPKIDKDKIIFNEGLINWDSTVYIVEGVFDMLSIPINTIPLLGKVMSSELFNKLKKYKPFVVIILDPDAYKSSVELFYLLSNIYVGCENRIKVVKLPTNYDIDELRRNEGVAEVIKSIQGARGLIVEDYFTYRLNKHV